MIEKVLIFFLFLCPLIFFHELGHFLFARLFGVKVQTFSLGFGPKILRKTWRGTEYVFSLIPLGGYVKLFGDDPYKRDEVPLEDRQYSFYHKSLFARFWVVFGGPLANFILAFVLFAGLNLFGENLPVIRIGEMSNSELFKSIGLQSGDVITQINDSEINGPSDLMKVAGVTLKTFEVERHGERKSLSISKELSGEDFLKGLSEVSPLLRRPLVRGLDQKLYLLSLTPKFEVKPLELIVSRSKNEVFITEVKEDSKELLEWERLTPPKKLELRSGESVKMGLARYNYFPKDLEIESVSMNSAADKAGIKAKDIVVKIDDFSPSSFYELGNSIRAGKGALRNLKVLRKDKFITLKIAAQKKIINDKEVFLFGVSGARNFLPPLMKQRPGMGLFKSVPLALSQTFDGMKQTLRGYKMLVTSSGALKNVGGPLSIGKVASDSFKIGITNFLKIMALISINLGLINLFPIPVLDGGHIVFIGLEAINKGPLSQRKMEIAQQFGLSFLFLIMAVALMNDFTRFF